MGNWTKTLARLRLGTAMGPVRWARWGPVSALLARIVPCRKPAVLVLSVPRSGSSWVGQVLGESPGALYLREPMTQTWLETIDRESMTVAEDPGAAPAIWRAASRDAFRGLPRYRGRVVGDPFPWALRRRPGRRVVIKEVRPRALAWLLRTYTPRVVFLVRHPAAVGLSARKLGWARFEPGEALEGWRRLGREYGKVVGESLALLEGRADARVVRYEDLCRRPVEVFGDLYAFAGLPWSEAVEEGIRARSARDGAGSETGAYDLQRESRTMVDRWRKEIRRDELDAMAEGWLACGLPLYPSEDWQPV